MPAKSRTKLDQFCREHGIATAKLAATAHLSRKHVSNIRVGRVASPGLVVAFEIARACQTLSERRVEVSDLFERAATPRRKAS